MATSPRAEAWNRKAVKVHGKSSKAKKWLTEYLYEEMEDFYFDEDLFVGRFDVEDMIRNSDSCVGALPHW